jgi:hypothetical protein
VLFVYWPRASDFFGPGSLGAAEVCDSWRSLPHINWTVPFVAASPELVRAALLLWAGAAVCLLLGCAARLSALVAWLLSVSFFNLNVYIHNAGDTVRSLLLFLLMLTPCGAVWSLDAWWAQRRVPRPASTWIWPWALRLLMVQMIVIYFFNGIFKLAGAQWQDGSILHYVLADPAQTRWSYLQLPVPLFCLQAMAWTVLAWEIAFPLLVSWPWARGPALWMGVAFHLGIALVIELAMFCFYMLCLYLPLVPWERWAQSRAAGGTEVGSPGLTSQS